MNVYFKDICYEHFKMIMLKWSCISPFRLQHKCFPENIAKFLTTPILKNICEQLLLAIEEIFVLVSQNELPVNSGMEL